MVPAKKKLILLLLLTFILSLPFCTRKDIEFGTIPENEYSNLVYIDTVGIRLSTVVADSFATSNASSFLLGRYRDNYLGTVSAKSFFQMTIPASVPEIPASALFDSLVFIFRPNDYYYGDTSLQQTVYVHELDQTITPVYDSKLYNTSDVPVKALPLGARSMRISPRAFDSISVRLGDAKGAEFFSMLKQSSSVISSETEFLNYFKGIAISVAAQDTSAVFGISGTEGSIVMRLYYHHTIPYPESKFIDFTSKANNLAFYQLLSDRTGTGLELGTGSVAEFPSASTHNLSFMQTGTGLKLKMNFPSLRSLLTDKSLVKLLKAELIIRPAYQSFDKNKYKLPSQLYLAGTDASNLTGSALADSTGSAIMYADPVIDDIYGENNYYRFNVTAYIEALLLTPGSEDDGFFVLNSSADAAISRLVANDNLAGKLGSQLLLSVLIINK